MPQTQQGTGGIASTESSHSWGVPMDIDTTFYVKGSQGGFQGKCYFCGKQGHRQAECRLKKGRSQMGRDNVEQKRFFKKTPQRTWNSKQHGGSRNKSFVSMTQQKEGKSPSSEISNIATTTSLGTTGILTTTAHIGQKLLRAVVDTGSSISLISEQVVLETNLERDPNITIPIKTVSGQLTNTIGKVNDVCLRLGKRQFPHGFNVVDTNAYELLLGMDFLLKYQASLQLEKNMLTLGQHQVPTRCARTTTVATVLCAGSTMDCPVYNKKKVTIQPFQQVHVPVRTTSKPVGKAFLVEPDPRTLAKQGVSAPRSLVGETSRIMLANLSNQPVTIGKEQCIAFLSEVACDEVEINDKKDHGDNMIRKKEIGVPAEVNSLLKQFPKLISKDQYDLGTTPMIEHRIKVDSEPIKLHPYRKSCHENEIIKGEVRRLLQHDLIEPSTSPWSFPVTLVKKKDGTWRFCIDFRKLNTVTTKDAYPIPRIDATLDQLGEAKVFSSLDLRSGYWQVAIAQEDREKTAFVTNEGQFQWKRMPFGLCNAPGTFQRLMDMVLAGLKYQCCLVYLDDVIVYSKNNEEHVKDLAKVFRTLEDANLKLSLEKCKFMQPEIHYLGHVISAEGIQTDGSKTKAMVEFPRPDSIKTLQQFLGLANYYRKFVSNFAQIARPLYDMLRDQETFNWSSEQEESFKALKEKLANPPVLAHPNFNKQFTVSTDASEIGIGVILSQESDKGEKPIAFYSRLLNIHEKNYSATEKECLGLVYGIAMCRPYIYGRRFKILTDHMALKWLLSLKNPTGRLARWLWKIQEYDFEVIHKPGKLHQNVDALSRAPQTTLAAQEASWTTMKKQELAKQYHVLSGHASSKVVHKLLNTYFPEKVTMKEIEEMTSQCKICAKFNHGPRKKFKPYSLTAGLGAFDRLSIDLVGPLPMTEDGNRYIVVAVDNLTRWVEASAIQEKTAKQVAEFLITHVFSRHGFPKAIQSDQGREFVNETMKAIQRETGMKWIMTSPYHPQANGLVERVNQTLVRKLKKLLDSNITAWDKILPLALFAYRICNQRVLGMSPYKALFGRDPTLTGNLGTLENMDEASFKKELAALQKLIEITHGELIDRFKTAEEVIDLDDYLEPTDLEVGDEVLFKARTHDKLEPMWIGPYLIVRKGTKGTYWIETVFGRTAQVHRSHLKLWTPTREEEDVVPRAAPTSSVEVVIEPITSELRSRLVPL
jgi:hypothetical protein